MRQTCYFYSKKVVELETLPGAPTRTYMGKIDTAIISCPSGRGERDGGRKEGREGEGRKERFDEKIAPPFVRPSVRPSSRLAAAVLMPIGASMAAAGKENTHWQRRRRRLRNCSRSSHMDVGRDGQPRRIGRLISGAKMRRESQGESGDITRAGGEE